MNRQYVQYGCGWSAPREWWNFDASPTLRFERVPLIGRLYTKNDSRFPDNVEYGDIVKGLPVPRESCKAVYCSHVLEHLSLHDFERALYNTRELLLPEGLFRFVLPDLEQAIRHYIDNPSGEAAVEFMKETSLGCERRANGFRDFVKSWLGHSRHLWMWDFKSAKRHLENAGFVAVRRAFFGDSSEPMFGKVEEWDRWDNGLGIECRRSI